jgi:hypothetical protein
LSRPSDVLGVFFCAGLACATSACGPFPDLRRIRLAVDGAGNPRFAVEQGRVWETGRGPAERIVYGESTGRGVWTLESFPTRETRLGGTFKLALDGAGRPVIAQDRRGAAVLVRTGPHAWVEATVSSTLDAASRTALRESAGVGGLWRMRDGDVALLADRYLFRLRGTTVVDVADTGRPCAEREGCLFDPIDDREGVAIVPEPRGNLFTLRCEDACAWTPAGDLRVNGVPYTKTSVFFHTVDRAPLLVQPIYYAPDYRQNAVVALRGLRDQDELGSRQVYHFGAAPRPGGGTAVVTLTYAGQLALHLLRDGTPSRVIDLGSSAAGFPVDPIAVVDHEHSGAETLDVLLRTDDAIVTHLRIDAASASVVRTKIHIAEP